MFPHKYCILILLFSSLTAFGARKKQEQKISPFPIQTLPQELVPVILSKVDSIRTACAFNRTCTEYHYTLDKILETMMPPAIWVPQLTPIQHTIRLVHYAQQEQKAIKEKMISCIMNNETKTLTELRKNTCTAFFPQYCTQDVSATIRAYQGKYIGPIQEDFPLLKAVGSGNYHEVLILLKNFPDDNSLHWQDHHTHDTLLIRAAKKQFTDIAKLLLKHCPSQQNEQNKKGNTALHYACTYNDIELVKALIQHKCLANLQNNKERTPLHHATLPVAKLLLQHGANPFIMDKFKKRALDHFTPEQKQVLFPSRQAVVHKQSMVNKGKNNNYRKSHRYYHWKR